MPSPLVVTIPVQIDRRATPNGRAHWSVVSRIKTDLQMATLGAMVNAAGPDASTRYPPESWPLTLHYLIAHGKGRKRLDDTNAIAAMKSIEDQIARSLGVDDRNFRFGSMTQIRDPEGKGYVRVAIDPHE